MEKEGGHVNTQQEVKKGDCRLKLARINLTNLLNWQPAHFLLLDSGIVETGHLPCFTDGEKEASEPEVVRLFLTIGQD